ncbi:MAG: mucoidy inhibitor MuiA family protein [Balneolaceae bacterium]|nr:mucoidy inhibitor MuiA family protein [Balneolaceae bacterium]
MQTLLLAFLFLFQSSAPDTTTVNTQVESVTVFLSGAEVHRTASVDLMAGTNQIQFTGLSTSLNEETIQLQTNGDIILESISKTLNSNSESSNKKLSDLQSQKENIEQQIKQKQAGLTVLNQKLNVLLNNQDIGGESAKVSTAELRQAMDYFGEQFEEIEMQRLEINEELEKLNKQLNEINQMISEINRGEQRTSGVIEMAIQSDTRQKLTLNLSYFVPSAGWSPSYDVRVATIDEPLNLRYKANIAQNTGVDWNNANLTISSAQPRRSATIPSINPVYLEFYQPKREMNLNTELRMESANEFKIAGGNLDAPMPSPIQAQLQQGQTAFSYKIKTPYTIKSGEAEKTVAVESYSLPASYKYFSIPKKEASAFLTANVSDWKSLNLLPGPINLFLDNSYVGKTSLNRNTVKDTLAFSLGKDKGLVIEREQIESFREKNFFGNKVTETKGWEITVRNTKPATVTIDIQDQVPVSSNEDIDVDLQERSAADYNKSTGILTWSIELGPSESRTLRFVYEITYPSGKQVQNTQ